MALTDEMGEPLTHRDIDPWWKRNVWGKMSERQKREWAKEHIYRTLDGVIPLETLSAQLIGRASTEIVDFFNW